MKQILSTVAFSIFLSANLFAQNQILQELIDLPAPPPISKTDDERKYPPKFYDTKNPPADDAPIEELLEYWQFMEGKNSSDNDKIRTASVNTSIRLIGIVEDTPYKFNGFLKVLPTESAVLERVKYLYDIKQNAEDVSDYWREEVKD